MRRWLPRLLLLGTVLLAAGGLRRTWLGTLSPPPETAPATTPRPPTEPAPERDGTTGTAPAAKRTAAPPAEAASAAALIDLVDTATGERSGHPGRFIRDRRVIGVLAESLASADDDTRTLANDYLLHRARPDDLRAATPEILLGLARFTPRAAARLQALLALDDATVVRLRADPGLPLAVRARLGDAAAEATLIDQFSAESDPRTKRELVEELGYVGSRAAVTALAQAIDSPVVVQMPHEQVALGFYVLEALARAYPDEPLLTTELERFRATGDEQNGRRLATYWRRVDRWSRRQLGVPMSPPSSGLFYRRLEVPRPLAVETNAR